jgi:hypothetical protein
MRQLCDVPRGDQRWARDNPSAAAIEFAAHHPEFVIEPPEFVFNESTLTQAVTYWPSAWLKRRA